MRLVLWEIWPGPGEHFHPNGRTSWLKNMGVILTTYESWDDPSNNMFQICFLPWDPFCQLFSLNGFWAVSVNIILRRFTHPKSSRPILRIVSCNPMPSPLGLVYQKITCILSKRDSPWIFVLDFFSPTRQLLPRISGTKAMEASGAVFLRYLGSGNTRSSVDLLTLTLVINNLQVLGWSSK